MYFQDSNPSFIHPVDEIAEEECKEKSKQHIVVAGEKFDHIPGKNHIPVSKYVSIDPSKILEFLERKKIGFKLDHINRKVSIQFCPFCHPHKNMSDNLWKLAVFLDRGNFTCLRCNSRGSFYDFQKAYSGISVVPFSTGNSSTSLPRASLGKSDTLSSVPGKRPEASLYHVHAEHRNLKEPEYNKALQFLKSTRAIDEEVIDFYQVGARLEYFGASKGEQICVSFPCIHGDHVPRIKYRGIEDKACQKISPRGGSPGFFGWHTVPPDATEVIITEGEFDAMAAYQGTKIPAISLPNGARSFPVDLIPQLERFTKVYLWLDDDAPGQEGAEKISKKLGLSRCYVVRCRGDDPEGPKDANDVLRAGIDMMPLVKNASRLQHEQITTFSHLRDEIFLEIVEGKKLNGTPFQTLPKLTSILKGHRKGELTVLTGGTGVGKTTILSQMSVDLCNQGVPTLWGSFEIRNHRLAKMMMSQRANQPVSVQNFKEIADEFEHLPFYFLKFHGATDVSSVLDAMDHAVYVYDVEHILLDNLQFMIGLGAAKFDRFEQQDFAIQSLRKFATQRGVHITLAVHPRKENEGELLGISSVFGSAKVTQEADNVILVQALDRDRQFRTINVQKNRYDGDTGHIPFRYDRASKRIIELTAREFEEMKAMAEEQSGGGNNPRTFHSSYNQAPSPAVRSEHNSPRLRPVAISASSNVRHE